MVILMTPSIRLTNTVWLQPSPGKTPAIRPCESRTSQTGSAKKRPSARANPKTTMKAISLPPILISSSVASWAEKPRAPIPKAKASARATMPLNRGRRKKGHFLDQRGTGFVSETIRPSGRRTETTQFSLPRSMTPSKTAWPPMWVGVGRRRGRGEFGRQFGPALNGGRDDHRGAAQFHVPLRLLAVGRHAVTDELMRASARDPFDREGE